MTDLTGAGLRRRLAEVPAGEWFEGVAGPGGELWFALAGVTWLEAGAGGPGVGGGWLGVRGEPVRRDTGVWLPPGTGYRLRGGGPAGIRLDVVTLPADGPGQPRAVGYEPAHGPGQPQAADREPATGPRVRRLADCPAQVTGNRRFRVLFGPGQGCEAATQFVGEIPPGRAPDHSHPYDEVVLVLRGSGLVHAGAAARRLTPGSRVHLPPGQPHCLENTGPATLVVLGVFWPGGSPAVKNATT